MRMHNPPHPGEIIREFCIEPLNLSVTEAANALGVTRKTLSEHPGHWRPQLHLGSGVQYKTPL